MQAETNMVDGATNVTGDADGAMLLVDTNDLEKTFYRVGVQLP